jgi:hypothetical protein
MLMNTTNTTEKEKTSHKPPTKNILVIGCAGVGKTWLMKSVISTFNCNVKRKYGKFYWHCSDDVIVIGKYDGSTFEGSDRLSMSVISDLDGFLLLNQGKVIIMEGDRFTNRRVLERTEPTIIKIMGDGLAGRVKRGSNQSERQLKSITTRVGNIPMGHNDLTASNSVEAMEIITKLIKEQLCATS